MAPARPNSALPGSRAPLSRPSSALTLGGRPISAGPVWAPTSKWPRSGRPTSAVPGWPGGGSAGGCIGGQKLWRPGSAASTGRSKQALFSPSFIEASGTRAMKDWQVAGDLEQRSQRHDTLQLRRQAASLGQLHESSALVDLDTLGCDFACPLARGPLGEKLRADVRPKSANWHKKKVKQVYKLLDPRRDGAVRLEQLRESFQVMSVPINDQTFAQYAQDLLPSSTSDPDCTVVTEDFINFHKEVWANQPAFVRWHAGDPAECDTTQAPPSPVKAAENGAAGVADAMMNRSGSAPSIVSAGELRNNEVMLRKSFTRHADRRSALISPDKIPAILQDLGLPGDLQDILASIDMDASCSDAADELTFHRAVGIVNKCIATHEASRQTATLSLAASKVGERLEAALHYSTAVGEEQSSSEMSSDEEIAMKRRASVALEAALFAEEDPITKAKRALEAALFGDSDDDELEMRRISLNAQQALEAALFADDHEETLADKARHAVEAALLGDDDHEEELASKAREALEEALFHDGEDHDDDLCSRAQEALEAALFNHGEEHDELMAMAQEALEAALLTPRPLSPRSSSLAKAQSALEAALFGEGDE